MRTVKHLVHEVCESVSETEKRKMFPDKGFILCGTSETQEIKKNSGWEFPSGK